MRHHHTDRRALGSRAAALLAGTLAVIALAAVPAQADSVARPAMDPAADAAADGQLMLVLDASSSMLEADDSGGTRIDAAHEALNTVIDGLDATAQVGLRVFGATEAGLDNPASCEDSQVLVPVGSGNADALRAAVSQYVPFGETPIGYALEQAAADLGDSGPRSILLVSDGESNCDPDPCAVAADLAADGIDLVINTVGLNVKDEAREQLQCIAAAAHGTYYDASDAPTLVAAMDRLATRAFRPFTISGEGVVGTDDVADAPELVPGGHYSDTLAMAGIDRHYRIQRTTPGSSIHVGISGAPDPHAEGQLEITLTTLAGESCAADFPLTTSGDYEWSFLTGQVTAWSQGEDVPCATDSELDLTITQTDGSAIDGTPIEILVYEEAPVDPNEQLPAGVDDGIVAWEDMTPGTPTAVTGGASFNDATELEPGTYSTEIVPGETLTFRVNADWGQHIQAQLDFPTPSASLAASLNSSHEIEANMVSPMRGEVSEPEIDGVGGTDHLDLFLDEPTQILTATPQIRWLNRSMGYAMSVDADLNGEYYLVILADEDDEGEGYSIPFTMTVDVVGDAGAGAPVYLNMTGTPTTPSASPESPDEPTASESATTAGTGDRAGDTPSDQPSSAADGPEADKSGASPLVIGGLSVLGAGLLGGGAVALARIRKKVDPTA